MFLEVNAIDFSYDGKKNVLNRVSFTLPKGQSIAIVGASGCGKSTLLRLISGILTTKNDAHAYGQISIDHASADEYRKTGKLAFMFQEATLMPNLTVRQNIALPLEIKGLKDSAKVDELLNTVGLSEFATYLPKQLSGGMKTRVALARSFATSPELLLLDEPFSALDISWKSKLYVELEKLRELYNTTVVMVTHDVQEALLLSNRVLIVNSCGEIQANYSIETETSLSERVQNVSSFLEEVYSSYFLPIQQAILLDGNRSLATSTEIKEVLNGIASLTGDPITEQKLLTQDVDKIRKFSNSVEVHQLLLNAYRKAITPDFKYGLIWDILAYDGLSDQTREEIFNYYIENVAYFSQKSQQWYAIKNADTPQSGFLETLKGRIEANEDFMFTKKWIYLCDFFAAKDVRASLDYLDTVIDGGVKNLNYPFAKKVAAIINEKIKNEKKADLPFA